MTIAIWNAVENTRTSANPVQDEQSPQVLTWAGDGYIILPDLCNSGFSSNNNWQVVYSTFIGMFSVESSNPFLKDFFTASTPS